MNKFFLFIGLLFVGCGKQLSNPVIEPCPTPTPVPVLAETKTIIAAFSAPWCSACKVAIPQMEKHYASLSIDEKKKIEFRIYVVTGNQSTDKPSDAVSNAYVAKIAPSALPVTDPWRWTNFQAMVGGRLAIPAAAVLDENSKVLKSFKPGFMRPKDVVDYAVSQAR